MSDNGKRLDCWIIDEAIKEQKVDAVYREHWNDKNISMWLMSGVRKSTQN